MTFNGHFVKEQISYTASFELGWLNNDFTCQKPGSEWEVSSCSQRDQRDGEVDVEVVGDDRNDVHVTHDSRVGSLHYGRLDDVRVHVDQWQEV